MRFKTTREGTHQVARNKSRKKQQLSRKILIASKRERKKAQKSNTSKGTMNVELNGTKPSLQLIFFFFFHVVLMVVVVLFCFEEMSLQGRVVMALLSPLPFPKLG